MPPRARNTCAPFAKDSALELAQMSKMYRQSPSSLMRIADPYTAWCLDQAIAYLLMRLQQGDRLRPKKTRNNVEMLTAMGVKIEGLEVEACR